MHESLVKAIKHGNLENVSTAALYDGVWELVEELRVLKARNKIVTENYITLFISHLEMMDQYLPEWRILAESEINQIKKLLK